MRVLIDCECSGKVREAFRALGHDAWSCDKKPATDGSRFHIQADGIHVARRPGWDLMIAHPDCTYLTNSAAWAFKNGPYHQNVKPGTLVGAARRAAREEAYRFFMSLWDCGIPRIAIENPTGAMSTMFRPAHQIVQPYQFGDDASKATGLWLQNLPPLVIDPALRLPGRMVMWKGKMRERWANQTDSGQNRLTPSDERAATRAVTYSGIARAMAAQWGGIAQQVAA